MNIVFPCPHCGQRISAGIEDSGVEADCPNCHQSLVVPVPDHAGQPSSPTPACGIIADVGSDCGQDTAPDGSPPCDQNPGGESTGSKQFEKPAQAIALISATLHGISSWLCRALAIIGPKASRIMVGLSTRYRGLTPAGKYFALAGFTASVLTTGFLLSRTGETNATTNRPNPRNPDSARQTVDTFRSAMETCHIAYRETLGVMRPEFISVFSSKNFDGPALVQAFEMMKKPRFKEPIGRLNLAVASAQSASSAIPLSPQTREDFERFVVIMNRNAGMFLFGLAGGLDHLEDWVNTYKDEPILYERIMKATSETP